MSRIRLICFAAATVLAAAASAGPAAASAPPVPSQAPAAPAGVAGDNGQDPGPTADDPCDIGYDDTWTDDASADDTATSRAVAGGDAAAAAPSDTGGDDSADPSDPTLCEYDQVLADDDAGATDEGGTLRVSGPALLKRGTVQVGVVTLTGPGTVTEDLSLTPPARAVPRASAASVGARAQRPERIRAGHATTTATKAGAVRLTVRLTTAAKRVIQASTQDVRITVKTTTKPHHGKAKTRTGVLIVKVK